MSRARASTTTGSSSRCRRDGETEGVEDGGGWWRLVEVCSAAGRSDLLHRPPPSSTNLQNAVSRCPPRHHHLHPRRRAARDRKSTRLNSSHSQISYAVFCLKKKTDARRSA